MSLMVRVRRTQMVLWKERFGKLNNSNEWLMDSAIMISLSAAYVAWECEDTKKRRLKIDDAISPSTGFDKEPLNYVNHYYLPILTDANMSINTNAKFTIYEAQH